MELSNWINSYYLREDVQSKPREGTIAKPFHKIVLLDDLFIAERIEAMVAHSYELVFRDDLDRHGRDGEKLPYDAGMKPMEQSDVGAEILLSDEFARFCANLVGVQLVAPQSVVKLRKHRAQADGFWIHMNLYQYEQSSPINRTDMQGTDSAQLICHEVLFGMSHCDVKCTDNNGKTFRGGGTGGFSGLGGTHSKQWKSIMDYC